MEAADPQVAARLCIHAQPGAVPAGTLKRLRGLVSINLAARPRRDALRLHIDDLHGRCLLALEDAGPRVEVPLPPGTYHVFACVARQQRCYTMTLESGRPFTLQLPFAARDGH